VEETGEGALVGGVTKISGDVIDCGLVMVASGEPAHDIDGEGETVAGGDGPVDSDVWINESAMEVVATLWIDASWARGVSLTGGVENCDSARAQ
jgi:hypothetical protein